MVASAPRDMEDTGVDAWIEDEVRGCHFPDQRLGKRLARILRDLSGAIGSTLPLACQDWAATKAAYRFLDNPRVDEEAILAGHVQATQSRFHNVRGLVLVLHDTTELSYQRTCPELIGTTGKTFSGRRPDGRPRLHTICGLLVHSSLVVTLEGLPLGLAAVKFWTRKKFKGTNALKRKVNATRVPIEQKESYRWVENLRQATEVLGEPDRCVHIGDRESDIFELFSAAGAAKTHFLVRTCVDRLAEDGDITVSGQMKRNADRGIHYVHVRDRHGHDSVAKLEIRYSLMTVLPPIGKARRYSPLALTAIYAQETTPCPKDRDRIDWKLLTNLPVGNLSEAAEKLDWYAMRWKVGTYHKILKSGCKAEEARLRTADRLTNLIAVYCVLSWRVFWLCMVNRVAPDSSPSLVFTETELRLLDHLVPPRPSAGKKAVSDYLRAVARLGGYLARNHDPPPGNAVIWRGVSRLTDIHLGFVIGRRLVGN